LERIQHYAYQTEEHTFQFFHCILDPHHTHILLVSRLDDMAHRVLQRIFKPVCFILHLRGQIRVQNIGLYYASEQKFRKCGNPFHSLLFPEQSSQLVTKEIPDDVSWITPSLAPLTKVVP
jgi:hypothetical protein